MKLHFYYYSAHFKKFFIIIISFEAINGEKTHKCKQIKIIVKYYGSFFQVIEFCYHFIRCLESDVFLLEYSEATGLWNLHVLTERTNDHTSFVLIV